MKETKHIIQFLTGDPYLQRHKKWDEFFYRTSVTGDELFSAYEQSCTTYKACFDSMSVYLHPSWARILIQSQNLNKSEVQLMRSLGAPLQSIFGDVKTFQAKHKPERSMGLLLWFIGLSLEFEWKEIRREDVDLKVQFFGLSQGYPMGRPTGFGIYPYPTRLTPTQNKGWDTERPKSFQA